MPGCCRWTNQVDAACEWKPLMSCVTKTYEANLIILLFTSTIFVNIFTTEVVECFFKRSAIIKCVKVLIYLCYGSPKSYTFLFFKQTPSLSHWLMASALSCLLSLDQDLFSSMLTKMVIGTSKLSWGFFSTEIPVTWAILLGMPTRVVPVTPQYLRDLRVWAKSRRVFRALVYQVFALGVSWGGTAEQRRGRGVWQKTPRQQRCSLESNKYTVCALSSPCTVRFCLGFKKRPNSSLIRGSKRGSSPSLPRLHCRGLDAIDSRRLPKSLNAQQFVCWGVFRRLMELSFPPALGSLSFGDQQQ